MNTTPMNKFQPIIDQAKELASQSEWQQAIDLLLPLKAEKKLSPDQQADVWLTLGKYYTRLGEFQQASAHYDEAYKKAEIRDKLPELAKTLHQQGLLEIQRQNYDQALGYFRKELTKLSSEFANYFSFLSENYYQQGLIMLHLEEFSDARVYLGHAITYAGPNNNHNAKGNALIALGKLNMIQNKKKDALKTFRQGYESFKQSGNKAGVASVLKLINAFEDIFQKEKGSRSGCQKMLAKIDELIGEL